MARRGEAIAECLSELQSESHENQQKALLTLVSITKVSPQNRNLLAQTKGVVSTLLSLSMSPSSTIIQLLCSLAILCLLARFEEGLTALKEMDKIVALLIEILKGKCMLSKEGAADILLCLFDGSEGCIRDALRLPEFSSVLADHSVRGSVRA